MTERPALLLIPRDEVLTIPAAARYARRSEVQIRRWCKRYPISRQAGRNAPIEVSRLALEMVLHGDFEALEELVTNGREAPAVQRYVRALGLAA